MLPALKNGTYYQSEGWTESLMEWEQIHAQQENGKWHGLLEVLQKILPSKNHNAWGPFYCNKQMDTTGSQFR